MIYADEDEYEMSEREPMDKNALRFLLDIEDWCRKADIPVHQKVWRFNRDDWEKHHPVALKSKSTATNLPRAYSRWLKKAQDSGVVSSMPTHIERGGVVDLTKLLKRIEEGVGRANEVKKPTHPKREVSLIEAAKQLDVSHQAVYQWVTRHGAPHRKIKWGKTHARKVSIEELEAWLVEKRKEDGSNFRTGPAVPDYEDVSAALEESNFSASKAHKTLLEQGFVIGESSIRKKRKEWGLPSSNERFGPDYSNEELLATLKERVFYREAAEALGLTTTALRERVRRAGLTYVQPKRRPPPSDDEIISAVEEHQTYRKAAAFFGVHPDTLRRWIIKRRLRDRCRVARGAVQEQPEPDPNPRTAP